MKCRGKSIRTYKLNRRDAGIWAFRVLDVTQEGIIIQLPKAFGEDATAEIPLSDKMKALYTVGSYTDITLIPQLAQGGVLKKGQWGFLEGNGDEAVMPLSKNSEWMDNVAKRMSSRIIEDFGHLQLDLSVPEIRDYKPRNYDMGALQNKIQMELDAQLAQRNYETSQQNELLKAILNKPTLQSKDVFSAVRKEANGYIKQYKHDPWPVMGRNW